MRNVALLAVLAIGVSSITFASPVGSIQGSVKDSTGALVPGVRITLTNNSTNAKINTTTNANGEFQLLQLAPATYSLVAEAQGFKRVDVPSVLVQVDQITHLDLALEIGSLSESVQVEAVAPLLENDKSTLSSVVNSRTISDMPLNARQVLDLALVTPGVVPTAAGTQVLSFNVAGARSQSNIFMWDGVSNMDTQVDGALNAFRITDAVQEFSVQTSVASAEYGRGTGGEVDVVTKSGTNAFHGSLFEYLRNSDLDAADFFTNRNRAPKNPLHRSQYGATFGGPIKRNKTFFFVSYEGFRQVAPTVSTTEVPTLTERGQVTDPISKALLQFWPLPNTSVPGTANNFIANVGATDFDHTGLIRIDHRIGDKDVLIGRFADFQGTFFTPGALPNLNGKRECAREPERFLGGGSHL
ncbi:MAG TPA: carboxypeptidase regulatory-like domain-containing protein [Bryobacteraceae bacterium]|nr:carboxypeptidase regulatory-like domain-containing protein [Bryobacteraceae bacterium]